MISVSNNETKTRGWEKDTVKCLIHSVQAVYLSASAKNNNMKPCLVYVHMWCLAVRSRAVRRQQTENNRTNSSRETKINWTLGQTDWKVTQRDNRRFSSFQSPTNTSQWAKLMVYIFIFIYLKCITVQKYRRSAAPWYIYQINTPFRQNKLMQKTEHNWNLKKGKARIHKE